ncbi:MAG: threonine synthase, partial [Gammaproteobacteria bacterium]|nr:threonine synthase [Gammaproteobacteria bacterium]
NALSGILQRSYEHFDTPLIAPLVPLGQAHVLELFHGPTLAFKDVALQFLGQVFDHILEESGEHLNIIGATSGDTGSAAIAGTRGRRNIDIFIMYPDGRTSVIQERQMTTVPDDNVHCLAIEGTFDDCQHILKTLFNDADFKEQYHLGAVNSVNWARILAQVVYYFSAWNQLQCPDAFQVSVPTGNFGNVFSAMVARKMGLPITRIILATNSNDILSRFFNKGVYAQHSVHHSYSPAMDIQVASNLERYLYYLFEENTGRVKAFMQMFAETGEARIDFNTAALDPLVTAGSADDEQTLATLKSVYEETGYLMDPHTAVGATVSARLASTQVPLVNLATAHPAKFADVIEKALPGVPARHPLLDELEHKPVRKTRLAASSDSVREFIAGAV